MELRQLLYFVTVVDAGSFSRGAVVLDLAQPSLSRQIALLEKDLGQRLLVRTGRGVTTTEAGEALLVHARAMLDISRRAQDELREMDESPGGRIVVGLPPRVALGLSAPLIQRFREKFPRAVITVLEGLSVALRESLIAGRLDLALLFDPAATPQLAFQPLMRERLLLVAPPKSKLPARVGLSALANYPMVLPSAPNAIRHLLDSVLGPRHIELQVLAEVGAVRTALALVATGVGCTILPESALGASADDALPRSPIGPPAIWNALVLATPVARPATRLTRGTAQLLQELDFRR
ncbi:LysR substrate-binding domain-containing protein [Variovorax sp. J22G21]|uniref:LysR substrate-binding domain-containing protein n=1 Tax=Variovorax fucosicus TaxID=3053517 RepID=UPI0025788D90|nr:MULTISPECIES: LysR substrate-binding domain-containing protein [unclassified Variovorax]MDM0037489.1 LysR substrate-binding domain-containing protein [Variovorax sp. J22R193]MDM0056848.1 LysR substrate-binding domain-containing protein [Variovorax sp. J22G47]MDM0062265.1 LysR substrate-binding domain-containing protein [Variovorax sp. J22G21]